MSAITQCRSCGSPELTSVLSLGRTPLANSLLAEAVPTAPEPTFPLDLMFCRACALVQIGETVAPEVLFRDYLYFSSFSETMLAHARALTGRLVRERGLDAASRVVEVASNDGYLLQYYRDAGVPVLGVEPAENVARVARERGIPTVCEFFGDGVAQRLRAEGMAADVIHANNVLAHVPDLNGFVRGVAALLKAEGVAVIEAPYVREMIDRLEFDTIYHEHVYYFSLVALASVFRRHGLRVADVERLAIHGGSLRLFVVHEGARQPTSDAVGALLAAERAVGLDGAAYYQGFARAVAALREEFRAHMAGIRSTGKRVAAYGAAAKGSTLLNYFGVGRETIDWVADRSTHKQGRFMPGVRLPIVAPDRLLAEMPDYVVLLTWNFADEILAQQAAYRARGGKFILPVPGVRTV